MTRTLSPRRCAIAGGTLVAAGVLALSGSSFYTDWQQRDSAPSLAYFHGAPWSVGESQVSGGWFQNDPFLSSGTFIHAAPWSP